MFTINVAPANGISKYETLKKIRKRVLKNVTPKINDILDIRDKFYERVTIRELFY